MRKFEKYKMNGLSDIKRSASSSKELTELEKTVIALEKRFAKKYKTIAIDLFGLPCAGFETIMGSSFFVNGFYTDDSVFIEYSNGKAGKRLQRTALTEDQMFQELYEEVLSSDIDYPANYLVAKSDNYYLVGHFETVCLYSRKDQKEITDVGDFYGDCYGGFIDKNERFCVTIGCGYIVYYFKEPFVPYEYDKITEQWKEDYREGENRPWIEKVRQLSDSEVELEFENGNIEVITI